MASRKQLAQTLSGCNSSSGFRCSRSCAACNFFSMHPFITTQHGHSPTIPVAKLANVHVRVVQQVEILEFDYTCKPSPDAYSLTKQSYSSSQSQVSTTTTSSLGPRRSCQASDYARSTATSSRRIPKNNERKGMHISEPTSWNKAPVLVGGTLKKADPANSPQRRGRSERSRLERTDPRKSGSERAHGHR